MHRFLIFQVVEELSSEIELLKADQRGGNMLEAQSQSELHGQLRDDLTTRLNELQMEVTSLRHQNKSMLMFWVKYILCSTVASETY
jgi:chaperonin cofactor prefoldin